MRSALEVATRHQTKAVARISIALYSQSAAAPADHPNGAPVTVRTT
jgi:hypothetical protein